MSLATSFRRVVLPAMAAFSLLLVAAALGHYWARRDIEPADGTVTILKPSPSVIVAVRQLSRLEGAVFYIERVIDLKEKQSRFFELVSGEDAILLVAAGEVVAGVELGNLPETAVRVSEDRLSVSVELPRATVLSRHLDNDRTYVHTRKTDLLAVRKENLETKARQEAEQTLEQAALRGGILHQAEESARHTLEGLLRSLGFTQVNVRFMGEGGEADAPTLAAPAPVLEAR